MCTNSCCSFISNEYSKICLKCGVQVPILNIDSYNLYSAPIIKSYNRSNRFRTKLEKLLLINTGPKSTEPVWKVLEKKRSEIKSIADLRITLRKASLKQKHYDSIRIFSKIFCGIDAQVEEVHSLCETILTDFENILFAWRKKYEETDLFFSSDWLLRFLITRHKQDQLLQFLKPSSKSRNQKYVKMFHTISKK